MTILLIITALICLPISIGLANAMMKMDQARRELVLQLMQAAHLERIERINKKKLK